MLPGWDEASLRHEALIEPLHAYVRLPGMEIIERPGFSQLVTPSFTQGGLNAVGWCVVGPDEDADAVIDEAIARYRTRGLHFRWVVPPGSAPPDLAERLARRGLVARRVRAMARLTHGAPVPVAAGVTVEEILPGDEAALAELTQVMSHGWGMDASPFEPYHRAVLAEPSRRHQLFLARIDGVVVGTASQACFVRSAYLMGGVVLPAFRRRGVYAALVAARLKTAAARGLGLATTRAFADTSAPLLERRGWVTICEYPVFEPPKTQ